MTMRRGWKAGARRCLILVGTVLLAGARPAWADFETPLAITNVKIITGTGETIDSGTILIVDGRIVAVGADVTIPDHADRLDATGLIAYPGFIDALSHVGIPEAQRTAAERERTEDLNPNQSEGPLPATRMANRRGILPQRRAIEQYAPDDKQLEALRAQGFTTVLLAPRGGILGGTSTVLSLSGEPIRRSIVAEDVAMHGSFSADEPGDYPGTVLGVFAQFRQVMNDARWYARLRKYHERHALEGKRPPTDEALESLQAVLARDLPVLFEANSEREIRRALGLMNEFELAPGITGGKEAWKVLDRLQSERVPLVVSLKFDEEPEYGKKDPKSRKPQPKKPAAEPEEEPLPEQEETETEPEHAHAEKPEKPGEKKGEEKEKIYEPLRLRIEQRRLWEEQVANVIRLHEAGVPFALTTDGHKDAKEFFAALRKVLERGLPEEAAVAALSRTPAELLGLHQQIGAIAPGRFANVVLRTGNLSDEKAKTRFVFVDGKKFEIEKEKKDEKKEADKKPDTEKKPEEPEPDPEPQLPEPEEEEPKVEEKPAAPPAEEPAPAAEQPEAAEPKPEEAAETKEEEKPEEDKSPLYEVELLEDRVPKTRTGGNVLIKDATVIPVTTPTLERASILVRDGKIAGIGPDLAAPEGVTVIEAAGRFAIPGFVDCHSHLAIDGVNEGTQSITAEVRVGDTIDPTDVGIYRAAAGGTTTHHAMHGSANTIGGQNVTFKLKYRRPIEELLIPDAPRTIKFALGENVTQANWGERGRRWPNTRMGVEAVMRHAFDAALYYQAELAKHDEATRAGRDVPPVRRDLRLDALSEVLRGELQVHTHCYRSDEILRLLHVAEDYGFRIACLQHVLEGYRIAPEIARHGCGASTFSNMWAYKVEAYQAIPHNAALMTQHGINVSINSDSPDTIRYFGQEAAKCVRWGGLTENEALRLVTINPAMQLGIDHRVGSLEVGKDADIAIFNGHPLNTFSKCVLTLIDGEVYFEHDAPDPVADASAVYMPPAQVDRTIPATPHRAYAIVGATIHPIAGPVIENGTVVVLEDKIHAVGTQVEVPPGAGVIDGTGLHVYPGLIDAGGSLGLDEIGSIRATQDDREIGTFNPHLRAASAVHAHSEHLAIARAAGVTMQLTRPTGSTIAGQSAVIHLDGWTADEMLVVGSFGLHMSVPSLPVHLPQEQRKRREEEHEKSMKEIEEFFAKAKHYAKVKALAEGGAPVAFEKDVRLEAMAPYVRGEKPVVFSASAYKQIVDTLDFAEKHQLKCILLGGHDAWKLADRLAEKQVPVILSAATDLPRAEHDPWDSVYRCAAVLDKAGVPFCFATGSASSAYDLGFHAGMAVAHGLDPQAAERALTLGAAGLLGLADRYGSIEAGKQADLMVTTATPLQTTSVVTHVFIDGRPVDLDNLHSRNYEKFRNRPAPLLPPARVDLRGPGRLTVP